MLNKKRKVVVVGAGSVGTTYIYALLQTALASEIILIDIDKQRVRGEVMDLSHGLPFVSPVAIRGGDYEDCEDASLIVVTAGAKQSSGQSRTELIGKNAEIVSSICSEIAKYNSDAVMVMVTNPVDTLTQVALEELKWPRTRIVGSGTVLDTVRFKYMLSEHCRVDARNVHAYILGEHGDSEVAAWSMVHIGGVPLRDYCRKCGRCNAEESFEDITNRVKDSAYHIIDYKGSTFYAIGMALTRITGAILRDEHSLLTVSTMLQGEYGISDVCLSLPCIVGKDGVENIVEADLSDAEQKALEASARTIRKTWDSIKSQTVTSG